MSKPKNKKKKDSFYKYSYKIITPKKVKNTLQPLRRGKPIVGYRDYFKNNWGITWHYVNRYIERVYGEPRDKYSVREKELLAQLLAEQLPLGSNLSIDYKSKDGVVSKIRDGVAITCHMA
jgi:signal peptidase I